MPVSDAYATASEYRARIDKKDTGDNEIIGEQLVGVSRYLDTYLRRFFTQDATAVARIFTIGDDANCTRDRRTLTVPDLAAAPSSVLVDWDLDGSFDDETALSSSEYELLPENAALGPEAEPYTAIRLTPWGTYHVWPTGHRVQVTAQWGWPSVPKAVKEAAIQITAILRFDGPRATNRVPEGFDTAIEASPEAQRIVGQLARAYRKRVYA